MTIVYPAQPAVVSAPQSILAVQIWNYLQDDAGKPIFNALVRCSLNRADAVSIVPPVELGPIMYSTFTDRNGFFSFNVVANNNITPATNYLIETPYRNYLIYVPSGGPYRTTAPGILVSG